LNKIGFLKKDKKEGTLMDHISSNDKNAKKEERKPLNVSCLTKK